MIYILQHTADDKDIIFQADNSTNGTETYLTIDGSNRSILVTAPLGVYHNDGVAARFGNIGDLQIYHSGNDSYIQDGGTGNLLITSNGASVQINKGTTENMAEFIVDGPVRLYDDSNKKLETRIVGVGTATTAGGTLIDGWKTTTQANAINDTTIATTAYVNNKIALIPAGLVFQGTWNAATNTPTLASGTGTTGNFYIVSVAGSTNLDGITDWKVGDWAVFIEQGASDQWEKIDNSSVLDGFGTGGSVAGWAGSGTSNTLTNSPITFSGNNVSFAGDVNIAEKLIHSGDTNTYLQFPGTNDKIVFATNGSDVLTLDAANTATFAGDVAIQKTGDVYLTLESTDATTTEEVAVKYSNQSTGSNYWWSGLNQSANYSLAYGTSYSGANVKMEISTAGNATFAGDVNITQTTDVGVLNTTNLDNGSAVGLSLTYPTSNVAAGDGLAIAIGIAGRGRSYIANSNLTTNLDASNLAFYTESGGVIGERMIINQDGKVGIGTTSPIHPLYVAGDIGQTDGSRIWFRGSSSSSATGAQSYVYSNGLNLQIKGDDNVQILGDGGGVIAHFDYTGKVGIGTTSPVYKLDVNGGIQAGGKVTYTRSAGSLNTTGYAVAGLTTSSNGQSAGFTFTCFGHTGGYQKIVYSCYNGGGTWVTKKVINEGTNQLDVVASANSTTITFTFKSISGTMSYTPRVTVEAVGTAINSTYA